MQMQFDLIKADSDISHTDPSDNNTTWLILKGNGSFSTLTESIDITAGDMIRFPAQETCSYHPRIPTIIGVIHLSDIMLSKRELLLAHKDLTEDIRRIFLLAMELEDSVSVNRNNILGALNQLMWEATVAIGMIKEPPNPSVHQVLESLEHHYLDSEYDLRADIEKTGYTPGHFRRIFNKDVGMSPLEFLNYRRIQYAKVLMAQQKKKLSVRQVAEQSGFSDVYYFSRLYKKIEGLSPKEYIDSVMAES